MKASTCVLIAAALLAACASKPTVHRLSDEMMKSPQPAISAVITEMFAQFPAKAAP